MSNSVFISVAPDIQRLIKLRDQHYESVEILCLERDITESLERVHFLKRMINWNLAPAIYIFGFAFGMVFWFPLFAITSVLTLLMVTSLEIFLRVKRHKFLNRLDTWEKKSSKSRYDLRLVIGATYS
jgi:hypothetical protein